MKPSDQYEHDVAKYIDGSVKGFSADRPKVGTNYSDIEIIYTSPATKAVKGKPAKKSVTVKTWLEVKMNHTDNLMNLRLSYVNGSWKIESEDSASSPGAISLAQQINSDPEAKEWIDAMRTWLSTEKKAKTRFNGDPKNFSLYSTKTPRKGDPNSVEPETMKLFLSTRKNKNICVIPNFDIGKVVTLHYLRGKAKPAHYMSAGDDFYCLGPSNPLKIPNVPTFKGKNRLVFRVGDRTGNYELQPEVKILGSQAVHSMYSVKPRSGKKNPFKFIGI
ncbi:hypothetical protein EB001_27780 [bacterium]|nr:hypothetical protein [bacterium]